MWNVKLYVIRKQGKNMNYFWLLCGSRLPLHSFSPPLVGPWAGAGHNRNSSKKVPWDLRWKVCSISRAEQVVWMARSGSIWKGELWACACCAWQLWKGFTRGIHAKQGDDERLTEPFNHPCGKHKLFSCEGTASRYFLLNVGYGRVCGSVRATVFFLFLFVTKTLALNANSHRRERKKHW